MTRRGSCFHVECDTLVFWRPRPRGWDEFLGVVEETIHRGFRIHDCPPGLRYVNWRTRLDNRDSQEQQDAFLNLGYTARRQHGWKRKYVVWIHFDVLASVNAPWLQTIFQIEHEIPQFPRDGGAETDARSLPGSNGTTTDDVVGLDAALDQLIRELASTVDPRQRQLILKMQQRILSGPATDRVQQLQGLIVSADDAMRRDNDIRLLHDIAGELEVPVDTDPRVTRDNISREIHRLKTARTR